jgi:beta-mannosidase
VGWYRLKLPAATGPRRWARLRADYFGRAWADERLLGAHEGYFEPWLLELPREPHTLWLRVAAPKEPYGTVWPRLKRQIKGIFGQHDCRPGGTTARGQERGTGGLWGGVTIFETGPVALLHLTYQTFRRPQGWRLRIQLTLDALAAGRAEVTFAPPPGELRRPLPHDGADAGPGGRTTDDLPDLGSPRAPALGDLGAGLPPSLPGWRPPWGINRRRRPSASGPSARRSRGCS